MHRAARIAITTDGSGDATVYSPAFVGKLHSFIYVPGTIDTGADLTITDEATTKALLTVTNAGTSVVTWLPRAPTVDVANAASLYAAGGEPVEDKLSVVGRVKVVVAQGAATKAGALWVTWDE